MAEPWFNPTTFGIAFGVIGGGVGGTLGGLLGAAMGYFAPRGKARGFVLTSTWVFIVAGVCSPLFGLYALVAGQPYGIWYPPTLVGIIDTALFGSLLPMVRARYRQAEERRIDARGLRRT